MKAAALVLLLFASSASAQDLSGGLVVTIPTDAQLSQDRPTGMSRAGLLTMAAGQGFDVASTFIALRNPNLKEGNPLGVAGVLAVKAGLTIGVPWLLKRLGATRRQSDGVAYAIGGIGATAGVWNFTQIQKARR